MKQENSDNQSQRSNEDKRSRSRSREKILKIQNRKKIVEIKIPDLSIRLYHFKQFVLLQTEDINPDTLEKGYGKYKKDWEHKRNQEFINEHKEDAWFNQKYNPQILELLEKEKRQNYNSKHAEFMMRFNEGFYNEIDLRVKDIDNLGTTHQLGEQDQYQYTNHHFINHQVLEIGLSSRINIAQAPFYGYNSDLCTIYIKAISKQVSRFDIKDIADKLDGYRGLAMSDPIIKANCTRNCWIQFDTEENCKKAVLSMNGIILKNSSLNVIKAFTKIKIVKILKNYPSSRLESDIQTLCKLVTKMDALIGIQKNILTSFSFQSLQNKFDILLTYLRKVHSFDYYTCTQYENQRVLALKTGSAFLRVEAEYEELPSILTVFKRIQQISEAKCSQSIDIPYYMSLLRKQIEKIIAQNQKEPIQGVSRCIRCEKKFKNGQFLVKHLLLKHQDIKTKTFQIVMEKLYLQDPLKLTKYSVKNENKGQKYNSGYRREKQKEAYRDFDEPEEAVTTQTSIRPLVNFLDI